MLADLTADATYPVNRLEHSLQCATRALATGATRSTSSAVCCTTSASHSVRSTTVRWPQSVLRPFVTAANYWMLAHHPVFQMYYIGQHSGRDPNERDQFASSPFYDQTVEFCALYDEVSFDPDYEGAAGDLRTDGSPGTRSGVGSAQLTAVTTTPKPIAVLFDIDETLVHTGGAGARSWKAAFEKLYGIPADIGQHSSAGETDPQVARATFAGVMGRAPSDEELDHLYVQYLLHLADDILVSEDYRMLPGADRDSGGARGSGCPAGSGLGCHGGGGPHQAHPGQSQPVLHLRCLRLGLADRAELTGIGHRKGRPACTPGWRPPRSSWWGTPPVTWTRPRRPERSRWVSPAATSPSTNWRRPGGPRARLADEPFPGL